MDSRRPPSRRRRIDFLREPDARFELILARDLGMTRSRLRRVMSAREYIDWLALYSLEADEREQALERAKRESRRGW